MGKGANADLLRKRLTGGLEAMIRDGSFDQLFFQYHGRDIARAELGRRRIIEMRNPFLPEATPLDRRELWFDPSRPVPP